jgi:hypothetical protein
MRSLKFSGCTQSIAGNQIQYNTLHAQQLPGPEGEVLMIFELTDEEVEEIVRTKKIVYSRLTFGSMFQPMKIMTQWPGEVAPEILPDVNNDPKLN